LLVIYAVHALALPVTDARIGLLFAAGSLGSFMASLLLPQLTRHLPAGWITLLGMSINLLMLLLLAAWVSALSIALVIYACWSLTYTLTTTNGISLRQLLIPDHLQSRVNAYARMIAWGGTPFGAALGGLLTQLISIRPALLIMALGLAISLLIGCFSPLRAKTGIRDLLQQTDGDGYV
jgi:predicted MFS family arabinose efflux permease